MSKKDYELIARVLKANNANKALCEAMANELRLTNKYTINGNKAFNDYKFLRACGIVE